jgi:hypothetical protein
LRTRPHGGVDNAAQDAILPHKSLKGVRYISRSSKRMPIKRAASELTHGITSILTFDREGLGRYTGIEVVHPADVISSNIGPKQAE